ncbi:hypothetical protein ABWL39_18710 [Chitinivorax sp. PXF-14]|uniref:hypothetical protein n=1 Tax=Chitinivorax sp. PXF-14 TaxID=3230488 RepID=UPI003467B8B2
MSEMITALTLVSKSAKAVGIDKAMLTRAMRQVLLSPSVIDYAWQVSDEEIKKSRHRLLYPAQEASLQQYPYGQPGTD